QIATYAKLLRDGILNPQPDVRIANDGDTTIVVDGDGGLGYFPAYKAAHELVTRCKKYGVAVSVTRNHGHFGAAGIYSRIVASHGLIGYVTSGHQLSLNASNPLVHAAGGSPMSFSVPAGDTPDMVLDFGATHDMYGDITDLFKLAPGLVFRNMGLGFMCQALGGFLAGVPVEKERAIREYEGANQGSLIVALDVSRFMPLETFKAEIDTYERLTSQMKPMPGHDRATLPGRLEYEREKEWSESGIPIDANHRQILDRIAQELGVDTLPVA
ncbi:MAG: hypothetical protein K0Q59_5197, partial [Paenibacillus sp.]|nr:hypothetical protein [Paenibacillus sp.]